MTGSELPAIRVRTAGGVTVAVPNRIELLTPYVLLEQEDWFEDEIVFLRNAIGPGMRVLDIGANYGLYSLSLAVSVGPSGRVWSVEPSSATCAYLRESIDGFGQVTLIQKALSDREGSARLSIEANSELNSISHADAAGATEEVPLTTLDALADAHGLGQVDFVKLDAEGEEERIIDGGARFLRSANPLIMFEVRHGERLNLHLVDRLGAAGYSSYRLVPGPGLLVPFDPAAQLDAFQLNLFACKPERAALLEAAGWLARDTTLDPASRYSVLREAYAQMTALCADGADAPELGSCARLARELGERQQAIALLNRALASLDSKEPRRPNGPFLPASRHFDAIDAGGWHAEWLKASLLDELITICVFSTYFAHGTDLQKVLLDQLDALRATGFLRAPMERRRQLMRIVAGLQQGPVPDAILGGYRPDNLNPQLWGAPPG